MTTKTTYTVWVSGRAWGGFDAEMYFTFDHLPTKEEVKERCGDFERYVIDEVWKMTTTIETEKLSVSVVS